jgi:hypothetical protein
MVALLYNKKNKKLIKVRKKSEGTKVNRMLLRAKSKRRALV